MEIVSGILEILNCLAPPSCAYLDRHSKFKQHVDVLRRRVRDLNSRKLDIKRQLEAEDLSEKLVKKQVEDWLEDIQRVSDEMQGIEAEVQKVSYFCRARLGKLVLEKIGELDRISQNGSFPDGLLVDRPLPTGITLPTQNLEGEDDVKTKIWGHLRCREVGMIGVCGIGGVGKTTVMKHIHNELLKEAIWLDKVIWVTVSHPLNVAKLQADIASKINISLPSGDELTRASRLMNFMKTVKYALILDDVWDKFTLQRVGIPEPTTENGCKIVITSRSVDVCNYLGCHIVKMAPLSEQESLNLFLDTVGPDVLQIPSVEGILKLIVDKCDGLPLAIVVIAGSMKGVKDIHEWRNAFRELRKCVVGPVEDKEYEIFNHLKFSYDRLPNPNTQNCFLYCSLYPEDFEISRIDLIEHWICEGFIEELGSRREMHDRGHTIVNRLLNNCLLEEAGEKGYVKMHDVVRDMGVCIKSNGPCRFMVKAGLGLTEIPGEDEWTQDLEKISLVRNNISYIPVNLSPKCSMLSTLILKGNRRLTRIPECFFANMLGLKFLDLSFTSIEALPNSMCNLECLTALILCECCNLVHMPSLEKLKTLKKLDLQGTGLLVVPRGIEMLVNLQYLDLSCQHLGELPIGMISNLSRLQYLGRDWLSTEETIRGEEVAELKMLESFEAGFGDLKSFNSYVKSKHFAGLRHYVLAVGPRTNVHFPKYHLKRVILNGFFIEDDSCLLPDDIQDLVICNYIVEMDKTLKLRAGSAVKKLFPYKFLQNLEEVYISSCSLEDIIGWEEQEEEGNQLSVALTLRKFRKLCIEDSEVKRLFLGKLLQDHQEVYISDCTMEEIIAWKEEEEEEQGNQISAALTLPTFRKLCIEDSKVKRLFLGKLLQGHQEIHICDCSIDEIIAWKEEEEEGNQISAALTLPRLTKLCIEDSKVKRLFLGKLQGHQEIHISDCIIGEIIAWKEEEEEGNQTTSAFTLPRFRKLFIEESKVNKVVYR